MQKDSLCQKLHSPWIEWEGEELPKVVVLHPVFLKIKYTVAINTLCRTAIHVTYIASIWLEIGIRQAVSWPGYCWWAFPTTSTPIMRLNSRGVRLTTHLRLVPGLRMSGAVFQITMQRTEFKIAWHQQIPKVIEMHSALMPIKYNRRTQLLHHAIIKSIPWNYGKLTD